MAFRRRTITGTLVDGNGIPITDGTIEFTLTSAFSVVEGFVIVDRPFTIMTDLNGFFEIDLWCDEDGLIPIDYKVTFPNISSGLPDAGHVGTFSLFYEDGSDMPIGELIADSIGQG